MDQGEVTVGRVNHVADLQSGTFGRRAGIDLVNPHPLAERIDHGLLVDTKQRTLAPVEPALGAGG